MPFNRLVFFTLFPKSHWIILSVGIVLHFLPNASVGNVLINVASFLIALNGVVIIHEAGHLLAAKAVGGVPRRMILGGGHEIYRTRVLGILVVIHSTSLGGYAYASFHQEEFLKFRYAVFGLGGVLLNVIVALTAYAIYKLLGEDSGDGVSIAVSFSIFLANGLALLSLLPYNTSIMGQKSPTDGLALLKLPFMKMKDVKQRLDDHLLFDGHEQMEKKDYACARIIFNDYLNKYPESKFLSINLAHIYLKTGQLEKSILEASKLLDCINDKEVKPFSTVIYNQLAWLHLVSNNIERADHFSALAFKAGSREISIQGTRGSVLVEKGSNSEGMRMLFKSMDFQSINSTTLSAAIYLMLGYHIQGGTEQSGKYRKFVEVNQDKLDADEKILFDRALTRIDNK